MHRRAVLRVLATTAVLVHGAASGARAQRDSATVAAQPAYGARGGIGRWFLGENWRALWAAPVRLPVLDLDTLGGLEPVEGGGDKQTKSLHLTAPDGREYRFRSVDKDATQGMPPFLEHTFVDRIAQDRTSALLPGGAVVATALLDAAGVRNPGARLYVLPRDGALGEYRGDFGGMLGTLEAHPNEGEHDEPLFAHSSKIVGTDALFDHLEEGEGNRLDVASYVRARLMDALVGDFDRHPDQWRWARYDRGDLRVWEPIPEDRDLAFAEHDGFLYALGRRLGMAGWLQYTERYPDVRALMSNSLAMNRRLLAGAPRELWDSVAADLKGRLPDSTLDAAVARLPPAYRRLAGPRLVRTLAARRDRLPALARAWYANLARNVEVHATDEDDVLRAERRADGTLDLRITDPRGRTLFSRRFRPDETREVRVFLHGGDDRAEVTGAGGGIELRLVGGGGDDTLVDRSAGPTSLYDDEGENRLEGGRGTRISRRAPLDLPADSGYFRHNSVDWGAKPSAFTPWAEWLPFAEAVIGGGPQYTRRGFRHAPYAERLWLRGEYAPLYGRAGVRAGVDLRGESTLRHLTVEAGYGALRGVGFRGIGNDSPPLDRGQALVWLRQGSAEAALHLPWSPRAELTLAATALHTDPAVRAPAPRIESLAYGADPVGRVGARAAVSVDGRDDPLFPRGGFTLAASAAGYPAVWDLTSPYGRLQAAASGYRALPLPRGPVLALRAGGELVRGPFPFFDAAFLGGSSTLRGYGYQRFAGDRDVFASGDLRVPLAATRLLVNGTLGASLVGDVGRVWFGGDSPGGWHADAGASAWFSTEIGTLGLLVARGEDTVVRLELGIPY